MISSTNNCPCVCHWDPAKPHDYTYKSVIACSHCASGDSPVLHAPEITKEPSRIDEILNEIRERWPDSFQSCPCCGGSISGHYNGNLFESSLRTALEKVEKEKDVEIANWKAAKEAVQIELAQAIRSTRAQDIAVLEKEMEKYSTAGTDEASDSVNGMWLGLGTAVRRLKSLNEETKE